MDEKDSQWLSFSLAIDSAQGSEEKQGPSFLTRSVKTQAIDRLTNLTATESCRILYLYAVETLSISSQSIPASASALSRSLVQAWEIHITPVTSSLINANGPSWTSFSCTGLDCWYSPGREISHPALLRLLKDEVSLDMFQWACMSSLEIPRDLRTIKLSNSSPFDPDTGVFLDSFFPSVSLPFASELWENKAKQDKDLDLIV